MSQIINITSEALQATIRRLLPSQQGFGEDLQASNVITPIIDLTPTAEGTALPAYLANAVNFTDATAFEITGSSGTLANTPGFYRVIGSANTARSGAGTNSCELNMSDGLTTKTVWQILQKTAAAPDTFFSESFDLVFFLDTGDTLSAVANGGEANISGSVRQVADRYGNISNPTGFTFE